MPSLIKFEYLGSQLWDIGNDGCLFIENSVIETIDKFRQVNIEAPESGGLLSGYYKGKNLHIVNLTTPFPRDRCSRYRFERRDYKHVESAEYWYKASNGELNCLGEWHTHPEITPYPSTIDITAWRNFIKNRQNQRAIFLIAGINNFWIGEIK